MLTGKRYSILNCTALPSASTAAQFNDVLFHAPTSFVVWQILTLLSSAVIYHEVDGFTRMQWILALTGVGLTVVGVVFSSLRPFPGSAGYKTLQNL